MGSQRRERRQSGVGHVKPRRRRWSRIFLARYDHQRFSRLGSKLTRRDFERLSQNQSLYRRRTRIHPVRHRSGHLLRGQSHRRQHRKTLRFDHIGAGQRVQERASDVRENVGFVSNVHFRHHQVKRERERDEKAKGVRVRESVCVCCERMRFCNKTGKREGQRKRTVKKHTFLLFICFLDFRIFPRKPGGPSLSLSLSPSASFLNHQHFTLEKLHVTNNERPRS